MNINLSNEVLLRFTSSEVAVESVAWWWPSAGRVTLLGRVECWGLEWGVRLGDYGVGIGELVGVDGDELLFRHGGLDPQHPAAQLTRVRRAT